MKGIYLVNKIVLLTLFLVITNSAISQYREGKIVFERRVNLHKTLGERAKQWVPEKNKIKKEYFELTFTDSLSLWQLQPSDVADPMPWGTSKNVVHRNLYTSKFYSIRDMWGDDVHIEDEMPHREWKITNSKRKIAGFDCRKAFWQFDDTTRIYAWYCDEIIPSIGPERFHDLPGAILGLATEDGATIYFAKEVEFYQPKYEDFEVKRAKKVKNLQQTREQLEIVAKQSKWMKINIDHYFIW